ncbi:MAG: hypothetical protein MJZ12_02515, partial [Prevotella sp.]|nr:hypothetical protein [Prevotella sp.]
MHEYTVSKYRYWFDQSQQINIGTYKNGALSLDCSGIEEGFHTLHYQVITTTGELSPTHTVSFFRVSENEERFKNYTIESLLYWFDQEADVRQTAYHSGATVLDVADLEEGFHTIHYQVKTTDGNLSPSYTCSFFRISPNEERF